MKHKKLLLPSALTLALLLLLVACGDPQDTIEGGGHVHAYILCRPDVEGAVADFGKRERGGARPVFVPRPA